MKILKESEKSKKGQIEKSVLSPLNQSLD